MKDFLRTVWRWVRWPVLVLGFLYAVLVGFRTFVLFDEEKTAEAVAQIHALKLEWNDINGQLPVEPDSAENGSTVSGVDSNNNNIRDDVERAIYLKYKDTPRIAIAMLQYAMNVQLYLTSVYNSETWKAVAEEGDRAYRCIFENLEVQSIDQALQQTKAKTKEVEMLVFNTQERKEAKEKAFDFTTSYGNPGQSSCDIDVGQANNN